MIRSISESKMRELIVAARYLSHGASSQKQICGTIDHSSCMSFSYSYSGFLLVDYSVL